MYRERTTKLSDRESIGEHQEPTGDLPAAVECIEVVQQLFDDKPWAGDCNVFESYEVVLSDAQRHCAIRR